MNKGLRHYRRSPSFFQMFAWSIHATCSEYSHCSLGVFTLFTQSIHIIRSEYSHCSLGVFLLFAWSIHTIRSEYTHCLLGAFNMMLNASNVFLALDKVDTEPLPTNLTASTPMYTNLWSISLCTNFFNTLTAKKACYLCEEHIADGDGSDNASQVG